MPLFGRKGTGLLHNVWMSMWPRKAEAKKEALDNLCDVLSLHFTPPMATNLPRVQKFKVEVAA